MARDISAGPRHGRPDSARRLRPRRHRLAARSRLVPGELDPGRYVFRLSGTGDDPVGDPLLILRDEEGRAIARAENAYRGTGADRLEFEVTGGPEAVFLDVSGNGPYSCTATAAGAGSATPPATSPSASTGSTARRSTPSPAAVLDPRARHRRLLPAEGQDRRDLRWPAAPSHPPAGTPTRSEGRWRRSTPSPRSATSASARPQERAKADFELLHNDKRGLTTSVASSRPEPSARAPACSPRSGGRLRRAVGDHAGRGSRTRGAGVRDHGARVRPWARARASRTTTASAPWSCAGSSGRRTGGAFG